jgi:transposase
MLHKYLLPILRQIDVTLGDPVFQQDNARIHTSNIMQRFFTRYNIDVADHPPYSPDLNPIEHAWVLLKRQVTEDYPDLADTPGGVDTVKARLAEVLPLCWEKIPETQFETLWKSMPDRVQAVIEAKGWQTRY